MTKDFVTVDQIQFPIYGERLPTRDNVGEALRDLEQSLAVIESQRRFLGEEVRENLVRGITSLYQK